MQSGKERNVRNVVAGFEVGSVIGIGTFGEVRYGRHIKTGARVALKIVDLSRFREDTAALLLKEIKILKLLHHKHVISIHDVKDKVPYQGRWCEGCACTTFRGISVGSKDSLFDSRSSDATRMEDIGESLHSSSSTLVCSNCGHSQLEHSAEETRHVLVMVQELAAGGELFGLLMHGGKFNEDIARYYFKQLIAGVEYCHMKGVIHRDLKPENLVLDPNFHLKIVDFGLASLANGKPRRVMEQGRPTVPIPMSLDVSKGGGLLATALAREREKRSTKLSTPITMEVDEQEDEIERDINLHVMHSGVGSQPYSAPEVYYSKELYNGAGYKGQPSDIWSCAVILFVMLTGRPPFLRPLTKTYGAATNMRRCKHFIKIMQGQGYGNISPAAKELLSGIFKLDPSQRLNMTKIKESAWFNGPVPDQESLAKVMEEKSRRVWTGLDKNEMVEVLRKMRSELEEEIQHRHTEERILVRNREIEEDEEIYTRTPRKSIVSSVPLSIKPPTSPLSPRSSAPIPIPTTSTPISLLPSPSPLTPSAASPSPLPSFSSVPSSYNPLSEADVNVSLLSLTEEEPLYRSLSHNQAFYSHSSSKTNNNHSNSTTHTDWGKSDSERSTIPKSLSDFPSTSSSSSSYHHLLHPSSLEKSFSSGLRFDSPQKSTTYPSTASPSNRRHRRRSRKGSTNNSTLRAPNARSKPSSSNQRRFPKKFGSSSSYLDSDSDSPYFYPAPLYQEAWRALQGGDGARSGSPSYSDELILRRAHRPIPVPRRPSSSASSSGLQISPQKHSHRQTRSVFSLPTRGGNIVPIEQHKKRREEKLRHTSFSGKSYGDSSANEQDEVDCEADEEILPLPPTPTVPTLPFSSMGIMRGSRFLTWSPLIRLLPTLASRLRAFGCTLICQGLSTRTGTSRSHREENGLVWTPLAKIRAVYAHPSPLTCILTIFRISLSESEKEKDKEKDEEEKWKETQALLVDCHRVKGDILLWNQLFQQLQAPIPLPPSEPADLASPSLSLSETESLLTGVDHKASGSTPMKGERRHVSVSEELEVEQL